MFPSEDESADNFEVREKSKKRSSTTEPVAGPSKIKKPKVRPVPTIAKPTARDLFGSDSDDDDAIEPKAKGKKPTPVYSYYTRRLANGYSRQSNEAKAGSHFIEFKLFKTDEIENVQPVNRWRHSIVTIKNKINVDSDTWRVIRELMAVTRKDFKNCPPNFISQFY